MRVIRARLYTSSSSRRAMLADSRAMTSGSRRQEALLDGAGLLQAGDDTRHAAIAAV